MLNSLDNKQRQWLAGFFGGDGKLKLVGDKLVVAFDEEGNQGLQRYVSDLLGCGTSSMDGIQLGSEDLTPFLNLVSGYLVSLSRTGLLNKYRHIVGMSEFLMHVPTLDWLVGLWDADGIYGKKYLGVSKSDYHLLWVIQQTFGGSLYPPYVGNIPRWVTHLTRKSKDSFTEVVNYLVKNSKNEPRRLKLISKIGW